MVAGFLGRPVRDTFIQGHSQVKIHITGFKVVIGFLLWPMSDTFPQGHSQQILVTRKIQDWIHMDFKQLSLLNDNWNSLQCSYGFSKNYFHNSLMH